MEITFSHNANGKLFADVFSDIRREEDYYIVGNTYEVMVRGRFFGYADLIANRPFTFRNLSDTLAFYNCGHHAAYQAALLKRFYGQQIQQNDARLVQLTFRYTQRHLPVQREQLQLWWKEIEEAQSGYIQTSIFNEQ